VIHDFARMNNPSAEIFSQGDEVITGEIADTNAAWLSQELVRLGFDVARHTAVGDRLEALVGLLREIAGRADLCLCTGGLGPTCDDFTAEAVSRAFGMPLEMDEAALTQIEAYFIRLGRPMPEVNRKQALLPQGADRLDNLWGTAPGFALRAGRCRFVFMPGVPSEMKAMFRQSVKPELPRQFALHPDRLVVLRTVGVGESALQERLDRIALPPEVRLGFRAGGPENQVKLLFPADFPESELDATVRRAVEAVGEAVYAVGCGGNSGGLETVAGRELTARKATLYAVETLSGGALANRCAGEDWFLGSTVVPNPALLLPWFGVDADGEPARTATRIAERARALTGADYVLAQFAGGGWEAFRNETGSIEVHFALAGPEGLRQESRLIGGGLQRRRNAAAALALDFVRRRLLDEVSAQ
jgi:nicotinamide-nucleotide amidase